MLWLDRHWWEVAECFDIQSGPSRDKPIFTKSRQLKATTGQRVADVDWKLICTAKYLSSELLTTNKLQL